MSDPQGSPAVVRTAGAWPSAASDRASSLPEVPNHGGSAPYLDWHGCYDGNWKGIITDESFAHPAKFARGLIERIIDHGLERGWWAKGDLIGDPFGGIGTGGIIAGFRGLRWIGVELEPRFVELAKANFSRFSWAAHREPFPTIVQGDSRRFAEIVGEACGIVTSPPWVDQEPSHAQADTPSRARLLADPKRGGSRVFDATYGDTHGQIGRLRAGDISAVVTSPPYADIIERDYSTDSDRPGFPRNPATPCGRLADGSRSATGYGTTPGNIGNLKCGEVDAVVTSPPFEKQETGGGIAAHNGVNGNVRTGRNCGYQNQGETVGNIASDSGETYWAAMRQVYEQCRLALKPGGIMCVVLKDYVKNKARVPLCDDSLRLLESLGFTLVERIRAWLVKESREDGFWGEHVETTERKSFFRRLAEKKGSPRIDWEEVIVVRAGGGEAE